MIGSSESWGPQQHPLHGTHVPVEEPSTASIADIASLTRSPRLRRLSVYRRLFSQRHECSTVVVLIRIKTALGRVMICFAIGKLRVKPWRSKAQNSVASRLTERPMSTMSSFASQVKS